MSRLRALFVRYPSASLLITNEDERRLGLLVLQFADVIEGITQDFLTHKWGSASPRRVFLSCVLLCLGDAEAEALRR